VVATLRNGELHFTSQGARLVQARCILAIWSYNRGLSRQIYLSSPYTPFMMTNAPT
jgi:hypothetical protein